MLFATINVKTSVSYVGITSSIPPSKVILGCSHIVEIRNEIVDHALDNAHFPAPASVPLEELVEAQLAVPIRVRVVENIFAQHVRSVLGVTLEVFAVEAQKVRRHVLPKSALFDVELGFQKDAQNILQLFPRYAPVVVGVNCSE